MRWRVNTPPQCLYLLSACQHFLVFLDNFWWRNNSNSIGKLENPAKERWADGNFNRCKKMFFVQYLCANILAKSVYDNPHEIVLTA